MSRPFSYQSFKAIVQYMDPNERLKVSQCCPEFHRIDKIVPFKINVLKIESNKTIMNQCSYQMGIYRKYPEGVEIPMNHEIENIRGGTHVDIDENDVAYSHREMVKGDIWFQDFAETDFFIDGPRLDVFWSHFSNERKPLPKFRRMIQLTVSNQKEKQVRLFEYSRHLYTHANRLLSLIFRGRKEVHIKLLDLEGAHNSMIHVIPGLKFRIKGINLGYLNPKSLDSLVLTEPVEVVQTNHSNFFHPLIQNAMKLVISGWRDVNEEGTSIARLPNQWIHISPIYVSRESLLEFITLIIREWRLAGRRLGTQLSAGVPVTSEIPQVLRRLGEEFNGEFLPDRSIKIPLCHSTNVHISVSKSESGPRLTKAHVLIPTLEMKII
uniref:F-box domain-containing protein n=1 Tax=Caenorhabditis tropicalis TaxID=1561998 RepID=A0A1I7UGR5_9PELO